MQQHSKTFKITRAGRVYLAFLAAFNSGDSGRMREFLNRNFDPFSFAEDFEDDFLRWYQAAYAQTGGLHVHKNYLTEEFYVIVIVEGVRDGKMYLDKMAVTSDAPHLITEYNHAAKD